MNTKNRLYILAGIALLFSAMGCQTKGPRFDPRASASSEGTTIALTNVIQPEWLTQPTNLFVLGPGDVITIGETTTKVGPDGKVYYQYLPGIDVWGLTVPEARQRIEEEMATTVNDPEVMLYLRSAESQRVWLLGRLNRPGIYSMTTPIRLLEALAMAGGPLTSTTVDSTQQLADLRHSFLMRQGEFVPVDFYRLLREGDMTQNIYLKPDDFIFVPSALSHQVYVLGAVRRPQGIPFTDQMTLVSAITQAGGTIKDAYLTHVAVVRGSLSEPHIAVVDYKEIARGQAADFTLEPRDIIYVPLSPFRKIYEYADLAVKTFVRTLAVNAGSRAVRREAPAAGVSIPVGNVSVPQ